MHTNTTEENGTGFTALGLAPELLKAVADAGYTLEMRFRNAGNGSPLSPVSLWYAVASGAEPAWMICVSEN